VIAYSDIGDEFHPCGCVFLVFGGGSASLACTEHGGGSQVYDWRPSVNSGSQPSAAAPLDLPAFPAAPASAGGSKGDPR
jgi:hypothetical protein